MQGLLSTGPTLSRFPIQAKQKSLFMKLINVSIQYLTNQPFSVHKQESCLINMVLQFRTRSCGMQLQMVADKTGITSAFCILLN